MVVNASEPIADGNCISRLFPVTLASPTPFLSSHNKWKFDIIHIFYKSNMNNVQLYMYDIKILVFTIPGSIADVNSSTDTPFQGDWNSQNQEHYFFKYEKQYASKFIISYNNSNMWNFFRVTF